MLPSGVDTATKPTATAASVSAAHQDDGHDDRKARRFAEVSLGLILGQAAGARAKLGYQRLERQVPESAIGETAVVAPRAAAVVPERCHFGVLRLEVSSACEQGLDTRKNLLDSPRHVGHS
jgi:hypothetical protein